MDGPLTLKRKKKRLFSCWHENEWCLHLLRTKCQFRFRQSTTSRYKSIPIYLSIGIDNRYQSITTRIFNIDWSSIININRLIDIDWYRLISIVIDYRFHRLQPRVKRASVFHDLSRHASLKHFSLKFYFLLYHVRPL